MSSAINICSAALLQLGKSPISSFEEPGDLARICANLYPFERDSILREHIWNCALKRVVLAPLVASPVFGYASQFALPGDCLRLVSVGDTRVDEAPQVTSWRVIGRNILAAGSALSIEYVWRNEDESTWDAKLQELMIARMLWKLAYPLTQSTSLRDELKSEYMALARTARSLDSQEDPSQSLSDDYTLITGRY